MNRPSVVSVVLAGFCAFLPLYAPQPILPLLAGVFHASQAQIALMITVCTIGVAIAAPVVGRIADRVGRKHIIVISAVILGAATVLLATSRSLPMLLTWRFAQGLATPGVFSVTTAYIHDEWPSHRAPSAIAAYVSGTIVGGFAGRLIVGFVAERLGWPWAFVLLGCCSLAIAGYLALRMPPESGFAHFEIRVNTRDAIAGHLHNPKLLTAYGIGFCVLFTQVAIFTYVTFHLAAAPFRLGPGFLGSIYVVYLAGAITTPFAGRRIATSGYPRMLLLSTLLCSAGAMLTLMPRLWIVIIGLAVCSSGVFVAQSSATSFVGAAAERNRALALGLYVTFYYVGGSFGGTAPGWLWNAFGWRGCVALVVAVQIAIAAASRGVSVTAPVSEPAAT